MAMALAGAPLQLSLSSPLDAIVQVFPEAAEPLLLPIPAGSVKVLPRWAEEDEVQRWRLKYRCSEDGEDVSSDDAAVVDDQRHVWTELELRPFTRELPLTGLAEGRLHFFKVAIEIPGGWSGWSRTVGCVPPRPELPGKCAAVFAMVKDDTTALIRWTRPIDYAAAVSCGHIWRYKLLVTWEPQRYPGDPETCRREIVIEEDTDCWEVTELECLNDYRFQVAGQNITGWGEYSDACPILNMPSPVPPQLPQPTLRRATHHSAVIQWQHPPASDVSIDSFRFRYTTSADWSQDVQELRDVTSALSQYVVEGLRPGEKYIFQVRALNRFGMGIWSDASIPIRTLDGSEPSKVVDLTVPHIYRSFITLQWPPAEENGFEVTRHLLRYAHMPDMSDGNEVVPEVVRKAGFDCCDLRHLKKTQYYFQVAALNKMGMAPWSDPVKVDLEMPPALEDA